MSMRPAVTIGLPCYNGGATLGAALQSIFSQTFADWELLLVDDGSDDASVDSLNSIADPRVRVVSDGKHMGLSCRLNQIADMAKGKYLARMDADDLMHPRRLERQFTFLDSRPDLDLLGSSAYSFFGDYSIRGIRPSRMQNALEFLKHNLILHPTLFGRTEWWQRNQYDFSAHRGEDKELWARTYEMLRIELLPEPLLFYREESEPAMKKFKAGIEAELMIFRRHGPRLVGQMGTAMLHAHLMLRMAFHCASSSFGLQERLAAFRTTPLAAAQLDDARWALREILKQEVPLQVGTHTGRSGIADFHMQVFALA